ncbi:heterokaryon incompatibility, partial [Phaeosphaeriaceae sp. PMI808]
ICCELITISLDGIEGRFDALSYSWGSSTGRDMIMINGANVPVTMNLNAALRRVRNTERTKLLWVDALCINQTDIDEKNVQVMRMKKIYTESSRVLVWLGDA